MKPYKTSNMDSPALLEYKRKCKCFIGIDPDCEKSGVAVLEEDHSLKTQCLTFSTLLSNLKRIKDGCPYPFMVVIEGGWLNGSNWHVTGCRMSAQKAAAIGRSVGRNHQTGMLIAEMCDAMGIPYEVVKPLVKTWVGKDGKITADELAYFTGHTKRTSQDERDAALLAWNYAGLPIKVKPMGGGTHGKG